MRTTQRDSKKPATTPANDPAFRPTACLAVSTPEELAAAVAAALRAAPAHVHVQIVIAVMSAPVVCAPEPIAVPTETAAQMLGISADSLRSSTCPIVPWGNKLTYCVDDLRAHAQLRRIDPTTLAAPSGATPPTDPLAEHFVHAAACDAALPALIDVVPGPRRVRRSPRDRALEVCG